VILLAGALFLSCAPVFADSVSVLNTNDGFGSSYTLSAVCTGNLCNVTLSIDTTSVGASYADVSNVDFKIGTTDSLTGTEGVEFSCMPLIGRRVEVSLVDFEAFPRSRLHAQVGARGAGLCTHPVQVLFQNAQTTPETERPESL
jgi:hypothetical protein